MSSATLNSQTEFFINPNDEFKLHKLCTSIDEYTKDEYDKRLALYRDRPELLDRDTVTVVKVPSGDYEIIDGRHTHRIAKDIGRPVRAVVFEGDEDALRDFVAGRNINRRHLSVTQRVRLLDRLGYDIRGMSVRKIAAKAGVSSASAAQVKKVLLEADPSIIEAVESGNMPLMTAFDLVSQVGVEDRDKKLNYVDKPNCDDHVDVIKNVTNNPKDSGPVSSGKIQPNQAFEPILEKYKALILQVKELEADFIQAAIGDKSCLTGWPSISEHDRFSNYIKEAIRDMITYLECASPHTTCPRCCQIK